MAPSESELTFLLNEAGKGDRAAGETAFDLIYGELHRIARALMRKENPSHSLQATELIGKLYVRLFGNSQPTWQDRQHFFATAARAMRRMLVDHARSKHNVKHGGGLQRVEGEEAIILPTTSLDTIALDRALDKLEALDPQQCRVVELRFFCGFTAEETADLLGVSRRTISRDWEFTRDWLYAELEKGEHGTMAVAAG